MSISATYSSSMFCADDDFFETVSIDLKDASQRGFDQILITRRVEQVCFNYDESNNHILEPSDWEWLGSDHLLWNRRSALTTAINKKTAYLVNTFNVSDVPRTALPIMQAKLAHDVPFGDEERFDNLLDQEQMEAFESLLIRSFGSERAKDSIALISEAYRLPIKASAETVSPTLVNHYVYWGTWS